MLYTAGGSQPGATTTFTLPDLQGTFIRGWTSSDSAAYNETPGSTYNPDPSRTFGSHQTNALEAHGHSVTDPGHNHTYNELLGAGTSFGGNGVSEGSSTTGTQTTGITIPNNSVSGAATDTNESRPTNIALLPIIKI